MGRVLPTMTNSFDITALHGVALLRCRQGSRVSRMMGISRSVFCW
jgi:hypothetical protein